jgi:hypothetical protein
MRWWLWLAAGAIGISLLPVFVTPHLWFSAPSGLSSLFARLAFMVGVPLAAHFGRPHACRAGWEFPWAAPAIAGIGALAALVYALTQSTIAAWVTLASAYVLLIDLDWMLTSDGGSLRRIGLRLLLALGAGVGATAVAQVETRFTDEEFFVAVEALVLALIWLLLLGASLIVLRFTPTQVPSGVRVRRGWIIGLVGLLGVLGCVVVIAGYQRSFFPLAAPSFAGISEDSPFMCAELPSDAGDGSIYDGQRVFQQLLARVKAYPQKRTTELGMLALGERQCCWAERFHDQLLGEASQGLFTGPAYSVKSDQHNAALRAYYYTRIRIQYPQLFTAEEDRLLREWFRAINRRALTVELVDWLYALAFGVWPEGPYANQENGAGLLALLEAEGLADPDLLVANRDYLSRNQRGWSERFRNTDDTLLYQPLWLRNAYFQSLYTHEMSDDQLRRSFEWMLLQALPDGAPLGYNHPVASTNAGIGYFGARLLDDPRYVWLSGRALAYLEAHDMPLYAELGGEQPVDRIGRAPKEGSCLLYGDSGLSIRAGPLAPDKIAFRSGWDTNSTYLLLNLRFTGWHRYKGTNTLTLLYKNGPLIADRTEGDESAWLPRGRSAFRDKRIPREQLNGLLVERTGMSAVLNQLTGSGGPWAQDPPFYARVAGFMPSADVDTSTTLIDDWHGWQQRRSVYFHHDGPVAIVDEASGPAQRRAALVWQLPDGATIRGQRIALRGGDHPAEMLILPIGVARIDVRPQPEQIFIDARDGKLGVVTLFLTEGWVGAQVELAQDAGSYLLRIGQGDRRIDLPIVYGDR